MRVLAGELGEPEADAAIARDAPHASVPIRDADEPAKGITWQGWDGLHFDFSKETGITNVAEPLSWARVNVEEVSHHGKMGMKLAADAAGFAADKSLADFADGAELRRARLYFSGEWLLLKPIAYEFEIGYIPHELATETFAADGCLP